MVLSIKTRKCLLLLGLFSFFSFFSTSYVNASEKEYTFHDSSIDKTINFSYDNETYPYAVILRSLGYSGSGDNQRFLISYQILLTSDEFVVQRESSYDYFNVNKYYSINITIKCDKDISSGFNNCQSPSIQDNGVSSSGSYIYWTNKGNLGGFPSLTMVYANYDLKNSSGDILYNKIGSLSESGSSGVVSNLFHDSDTGFDFTLNSYSKENSYFIVVRSIVSNLSDNSFGFLYDVFYFNEIPKLNYYVEKGVYYFTIPKDVIYDEFSFAPNTHSCATSFDLFELVYTRSSKTHMNFKYSFTAFDNPYDVDCNVLVGYGFYSNFDLYSTSDELIFSSNNSFIDASTRLPTNSGSGLPSHTTPPDEPVKPEEPDKPTEESIFEILKSWIIPEEEDVVSLFNLVQTDFENKFPIITEISDAFEVIEATPDATSQMGSATGFRSMLTFEIAGHEYDLFNNISSDTLSFIKNLTSMVLFVITLWIFVHELPEIVKG